MNIIIRTLSIGIFLNLAMVNLANANSAFVDSYIENFQSGSLALQAKTCEKIYDYSGITNEQLFDLVEMKLLHLAGQDKFSREEKNAASCFVKALASSGKEKYRESLKTVSEHANNRKLRKTAEEFLPKIEKYRRWNPVINSNEYELEGRSEHIALWMRLVASDDPDMGLYAIEKARTFKNHDLNFLVLLEEKLHAAIPQKAISEARLDFYRESMNYLMAHPDFGKYTSLINKIAEQAKNEKLQKLARRALRL